jgi:hypothetical protein
VTTPIENLIDGLADRLVPVPPRSLERRLLRSVAIGGIVILALIIALIGLRPDLRSATSDSDFWIKLIFTGTIAAIALIGARRLARPEVSGITLTGLTVPVGILGLLAMFELGTTAPVQRNALIFGESWRECPLLIAALALPLLAILLRLFAGFAPQRPRLTGAVVGLAAGATTAMLYSLHCPETAMTFLLLWYSAGIATVAVIGAMLGPRILRW